VRMLVSIGCGEPDHIDVCRVLVPPGPPPPGVHVSEDGASVATPVCPMEWFLSFYEECCELYGQPQDTCAGCEQQCTVNCVGTANAGDEHFTEGQVHSTGRCGKKPLGKVIMVSCALGRLCLCRRDGGIVF
jgi:hypothetical protein